MDSSILRLARLLGTRRLLSAQIVLPTPEYFPDPYDQSELALQRMSCRVASRMGLSAEDIEVCFYRTEHAATSSLVPFFSGHSSDPAGLYHHDPAVKPQISIDEALMKDPIALVAVLAHELGHIVLLRPGLVGHDEPDMEPLNDLFTVFAGFGIFTANSAFRFEQHSSYDTQGWSARRLGYLSEQQFGYALARFAFERGELKPRWKTFLCTNVASFFRCSLGWLVRNPDSRLLRA